MPLSLPMLKGPQIEHPVVGAQSARAPPQFRFQLVSDAASVQITPQRALAPFGCQRSQVSVGQCLCIDHGLDCGGRGPLIFAVRGSHEARRSFITPNATGPD